MQKYLSISCIVMRATHSAPVIQSAVRLKKLSDFHPLVKVIW